MIPVKDSHQNKTVSFGHWPAVTRIKPLALASGHGRHNITCDRFLICNRFCWTPLALRPAPTPPCFPSGLDPPCALRPLWCILDLPLRPPAPLVSLDPPACPPVPLVSRGSYSKVV
jgi:hypothetical protein